MRMSRKTVLIVSAAVAGAFALGAVGTTAAVASGSHGKPAASAVRTTDPSAMLGQLTDLAAVGKVADTLKAALAGTPDSDRVAQLAEEAKKSLDDMSAVAPAKPAATGDMPGVPEGQQVLPGKPAVPAQEGDAAVPGRQAFHGAPVAGSTIRSAARPSANELIIKASAQVKTALDGVVKAVAAKNVAKIHAKVEAAVQATVNLNASLVIGGGLPVPNMPGLPKLPSLANDPASEVSLPEVGSHAER